TSIKSVLEMGDPGIVEGMEDACVNERPVMHRHGRFSWDSARQIPSPLPIVSQGGQGHPFFGTNTGCPCSSLQETFKKEENQPAWSIPTRHGYPMFGSPGPVGPQFSSGSTPAGFAYRRGRKATGCPKRRQRAVWPPLANGVFGRPAA